MSTAYLQAKRFAPVAIIAAAAVLIAAGLFLATTAGAADLSDYNLVDGDLVTTFEANGNPDINFTKQTHNGAFTRNVLSPAVAAFYGSLYSDFFGQVKQITPAAMESLPLTCYVTNGETNDGKVYYMEITGKDTAVLRHIALSGSQAVAFDPLFFSRVFSMNSAEENHYAKGAAITDASQIPACASHETGDDTSTPVSGGVSVSTAANNPAGATVPKGASGVTMLRFNVTNTNNTEVTVTNATVHRTGAGATSDFDNVYLYDGMTRLTSGRSVNSSSNNAVFSSLSVKVPANSTKTLEVVGDIATGAGAGNVHALNVTSLTASSATATGSTNGNNFTIAGTTAGTITIAKNGTLTNPKAGETGVEVAQFRLTAGSTEDIELHRVALFQAGNVSRSNLTNFMLKDTATGTTLATTSSVTDKDLVVFDLSSSPVLLSKGNAKTYSVYADVSGSAKANDTIRFHLDDANDLLAIGKTFGYGASVTRTDYDNSADDGTDQSRTTVQAGQLTISFVGPAASDIAENGKDVEVMTFSLSAQSNLELRQFGLDFDGGVGTANFVNSGTQLYTDVKIWDTTTNTVVWGPDDMNDNSDTTESITFSEDIVLNAGETRTYKVTMDVATTTAGVVDGDDIRAYIDMSDITSSQVRNLDNNTYLTSSEIVPSTDLYGNTHTVAVPSLTVTLATTPTSQTFVKGSLDVPFVGFNFAAGTGGDIRVSAVTITGYIDENATGGATAGTDNSVTVQQVVPKVRLKVDGSQVGTDESPNSSTGEATFDNLNMTVSAGTTKVVKVYGDLSASAFVNSDSEKVSFDIDDVSAEITAADLFGSSVTATGDAVNGGTSQTRAVTIGNTGTLTVSRTGTEEGVHESRIVNAGEEGVTLSKFRFVAQNDQMTVNSVRVRLDSIAAGADVSDNVLGLALYDGDTQLKTYQSLTPASAAGTLDAYVDFNDIGLVVPKDDSDGKILTVKANLNTLTTGNGSSGDEFSVDLAYAQNFEASDTTGTKTTSVGSSNVAGYDVVIRKGQPIITVMDLPSTTLSNDTVTLAKFSVRAEGGSIALKHFTFQPISSDTTNVDLSSHAIRREGGSNLSISSTPETSSSSGTFTIDITFASEEQLNEGQTVVYEYRAEVSGAAAADSIGTKILGDTAIVTGDLGTIQAALQIDDLDGTNNVGDDSDVADAAYNFIWSDRSAVTHDDTADGTDDWTNGRYVDVVPTDSKSLTFPS